MRATSTISLVSTTETLLGTGSPCRLKFTAKRKLPSGVTSAVAGKSPKVTCFTTWSVAVSYFTAVPYGLPWPMVTKKFFLSGENAIPCGPLISLCRIRVSVVFSTTAPPGPNFTVAIRSADSQTSFTQYSFAGGAPQRAPSPQFNSAHKMIGFQKLPSTPFMGLSVNSRAFYLNCSVNLALDVNARLLRHFLHANHAFSH